VQFIQHLLFPIRGILARLPIPIKDFSLSPSDSTNWKITTLSPRLANSMALKDEAISEAISKDMIIMTIHFQHVSLKLLSFPTLSIPTHAFICCMNKSVLRFWGRWYAE